MPIERQPPPIEQIAQRLAARMARDGIRVEVLASDDLRVGQVRIGKSQEVAHE